VTDQISLLGLDHVIVCTAVEGKIYFRHYSIKMKKSGTNVRCSPFHASFLFARLLAARTSE
jgi:hypothetical protein